MHFRNIFLIASLALNGFSTTVPKPPTTSSSVCLKPTPSSSPPPPGETYVTSWPICGVAGYNQVPGSYIEITYKQSNSTLIECMEACRKTLGCESIAFVNRYTECLFYDRLVRGTQLCPADSGFAHYDLSCAVYA